MNPLHLFLIEVAISLSVSALTITFIQRYLNGVLIELCGNETRAKFWSMYVSIMLTIAPLLFVIVFGQSYFNNMSIFLLMKSALGYALFGVFVSLIAIGMRINQEIPRFEAKTQLKTE